MKTARLISSAVLILVLMAPLGAQTRGQETQRLTAEVPFDFMVKRVMFPAGAYVVTLAGDRTVYLRASRGRESMSIAAEPIRTVSHSRSARLIFSEENGHYQLRELWMNSTTGRAVPPTVELRNVHAARLEVRASCTTCQ
ncbi:MAG TPA: hypothetical protein VEI52_08755 [Terriglobales bacterium]|nr:hypothetical protein [Terriglobales bacterium]